MKIAIKVITEWDRLNVIAFFEKHFPECNSIVGQPYSKDEVQIGDIWFIKKGKKNDYLTYSYSYSDKSQVEKMELLQGVPKDMELPKLEPTKTREQELEEFVKFTFNIVDKLQFPTESELKEISTKAKQLLNK